MLNLNHYPFAVAIRTTLIIVIGLLTIITVISKLKKDKQNISSVDVRIELEPVNSLNKASLLQIVQEDILLTFMPSIENIISLAEYNTTFGAVTLCHAIKYNNKYVGIISIGESTNNTLPPQFLSEKLYILHGLVLESKYRRIGIGSIALTRTIQHLFDNYEVRPVLRQCHKDNQDGQQFLLYNDFINTEIMNQDETAYYFLFK